EGVPVQPLKEKRTTENTEARRHRGRKGNDVMIRFGLLCVSSLGVLCVSVVRSPASDPTYWQDVRPVLRKHCTVCHRESKRSEPEVSAGLALDSPAGVRRGSANRP